MLSRHLRRRNDGHEFVGGDALKYIPFTEEQKQQANNTDLVAFLEARGEKLRKLGRDYKLIYTDASGTHDSITVHGSTWFDHKNQVGGGAVKFMQHHYHMTFQEAVQALLGYAVEPVQRSPPVMAAPVPKREFRLPEAHSDMHRVYAYLIKQRFIAPEIITHFAKAHTLYEDAAHHNAVFVGLDENGVPRQASKRSTASFGQAYKLTCEGSDTRYSFAHFGTSGRLFVFEAPIDLLSFLTLYPKDWQEHSYIATNGVYEKAMLRALEMRQNLREIIICTDNDDGGNDAAYRFRDILREHGYTDVKRLAPPFKDWNEVLKAANGVDALPAVLYEKPERFSALVGSLEEVRFSPERAAWILQQELHRGNYHHAAQYALAGAAFFLRQSGHPVGFSRLKQKLRDEYKPYADKAQTDAKRHILSDAMKRTVKELHRPARTQEQSVQTAKALYELADAALKLEMDCGETPVQSEGMDEALSLAYG